MREREKILELIYQTCVRNWKSTLAGTSGLVVAMLGYLHIGIEKDQAETIVMGLVWIALVLSEDIKLDI